MVSAWSVEHLSPGDHFSWQGSSVYSPWFQDPVPDELEIFRSPIMKADSVTQAQGPEAVFLDPQHLCYDLICRDPGGPVCRGVRISRTPLKHRVRVDEILIF